jgi:hypothetical protein
MSLAPGTSALVFSTTIVSGQTDTDGVAIAINALTLNWRNPQRCKWQQQHLHVHCSG